MSTPLTNTADKITVMSAYLKGATIEWRYIGEDAWHTCTNPPGWNFNQVHYRVQPAKKPDVVSYDFVRRYDAYPCSYRTLQAAKDEAGRFTGVTFVEIVHDGETGEVLSLKVAKD